MRSVLPFALVVGLGCRFDSSGLAVESSTGTTSSESGSTTTNSTVAPTSTAADTIGDASDESAPTTTTNGTDTSAGTSADSGSTGSTGSGPACTVDDGGCDPDATCDNGEPAAQCTCNPGFVGDGSVCATTPVLPTLRAELPCTGIQCFGGSTCYTDGEVDAAVVLAGELGVTYEVTLAVRGVLEQKEYPGGRCDGLWCVGGEPDGGPWNAVTIAVSDPPAEYHPNAGMAGLYEVFAIDYERTIPIAAGATITVTIDGYGTCSINNDQGLGIPGVPPDPEIFDGQFLQVDLVDATLPG